MPKARQIRISGGELRGRVLRAAGSSELRPTTDRNREAIFSTLFSLGGLEGSRVLDLYAGTGALGVEALSRGAKSAVFVESHRQTAWHLEENLKNLGLFERSKVICQPVERFLSSADTGFFSLVFADPPYESHPGAELLLSIISNGLLASSSIIVLEGDSEMKNIDISGVEQAAAGVELRLKSEKVVSQGDTSLIYCSFAGEQD